MSHLNILKYFKNVIKFKSIIMFLNVCMHDFQELLKHRKIFDDSLPTLYIDILLITLKYLLNTENYITSFSI